MSRSGEDRIYTLVGWLAAIVLVVVVILIRLAIAGGDWSCVFSQDPAICVALKGVGS